MDPKIQLFIYILAGITLSFAAINLSIGFQKGCLKTYLFLGLIGIGVGIYYLLFPYMTYEKPLPVITKVSFFFFLANFALLPWFFCHYTGYCKSTIQWLLSSGMALAYLLLLITGDFFELIIWNKLAHLVLVGIIIFGYKAALYQKKKGDTKSAWLLIVALIFFTLITIDDIFRVHLPSIYPFSVPDNVLPLDYFLVLFMIIMGLKLVEDMHQKYHLEKSINVQQKRWQYLLERVGLLVVGVNTNGEITYVNPYFLKLTGFRKEDIIGNNYIMLIPETDRKALLQLTESINKPEELPYYQNNILTQSGKEITISWSAVGLYDDDGKLISSVSIGTDITERMNAFDEIELLKGRLEEENILLKAELGKLPTTKKIIGKSDALRYALQRALQVAAADSTVLLEGETGVGKELIANYIQENSQRSENPFIKLNCAAIPSSLLESELFGHVKGAFTGADKNKKGMVEMADGGTLLLDEIGEFPLELQPKLLRFLQEGEFQPLGSETQKKVDVRIIAATNRELLHEIEKGRFRNDLYYRLYVYPITIPPLRNRVEEIPDLIDVFVKRYAKKHGKYIKQVSKLVIEELKKYKWPGNIRELENVIEHAVIVCNSDTIKMKDMNPFISGRDHKTSKAVQEIVSLEEAEKLHITKALDKCKWQVHGKNGAAELLEINPSTLRSRMKKLNITIDQKPYRNSQF
ncbi:MAG: sigma 54-interacting transcriptional regulator [Bacteroidales bacterium]|nr:sigma 54-interacting transcriptional regulator [Bacteroidales bacterium]